MRHACTVTTCTPILMSLPGDFYFQSQSQTLACAPTVLPPQPLSPTLSIQNYKSFFYHHGITASTGWLPCYRHRHFHNYQSNHDHYQYWLLPLLLAVVVYYHWLLTHTAATTYYRYNHNYHYHCWGHPHCHFYRLHGYGTTITVIAIATVLVSVQGVGEGVELHHDHYHTEGVGEAEATWFISTVGRDVGCGVRCSRAQGVRNIGTQGQRHKDKGDTRT